MQNKRDAITVRFYKMCSIIILTIVGSFCKIGIAILGRTNSSIVKKCSL